MDFEKRIELYYGQSPVKGDTKTIQECLDKENEFCAVYTQNDLPAEVHNRTNEHMQSNFGVNSEFAKENGSYIKPYMLDTKTGKATIGPDSVIQAQATPESLRGTGVIVGGTFFHTNIADTVLKEFQNQGYKTIRKYE